MKPIMYTLTITPRFNSKIHQNTHVADSLVKLKEQLESDFVFFTDDQKALNVEIVFGISNIIAVVRDDKGMQLTSKQSPFSVESSIFNLAANLCTTIHNACSSESVSRPAATSPLLLASNHFFSAFCDSINSVR